MKEMQIHKLQQGTNEWHQFRAEHFGASEAAAMLGTSKYMTRTDLLKLKKNGIDKEISDTQQNIFNKGHVAEEGGRKIMEEIIALDLYPVTCSRGKYSASCDGLTMDHTIAFEHKLWNKELAALVEEGKVPDSHMPQLQQVLMVTGAIEIFFVVSDGTEENFRYTRVKPSPIWFKKIEAGWNQFENDLESFVPPVVEEMPEPEVIKDLPSLVVEIKGEVTKSNLLDFKAASDEQLARVPKNPETDVDFVNSKEFCKKSEEVEKKIKLLRKTIEEKCASVNEVFSTLDEIASQWRTMRLSTEKKVKRKEEALKLKIINEGRMKFDEHKVLIEKTIEPIKLTTTDSPIVVATKNKKTLESMREAVSVALSQTMVAATTEGLEVTAKLDWARDPDGGNINKYKTLFGDLQDVIQKPIDDFKLVVKSRIDGVVNEVKGADEAGTSGQVPPEDKRAGESEYLPSKTARKEEAKKKKVDDVMIANIRNDIFIFGNKYKEVSEVAGILSEMDKFIKTTEPKKESMPF